jgi:TetR/AcrR family transcriptional regulator, lmrAB and yxaGH operons repressor
MLLVIVTVPRMNYVGRHSQEGSGMVSDSRTNMVRSAASIIATRGANGTSFSDVIADSGAPRGSIYHHFPNGKREMVVGAIGWTSDQVLEHLRGGEARTPREVLKRFIDLWRASVRASGGASGCAVAATALDSDGSQPELIEAAHVAFRSWSDLLAEQLRAVGVRRNRAGSIAVTALAAMEGALILCRAEGSGAPLEAVAGELMRLNLHADST